MPTEDAEAKARANTGAVSAAIRTYYLSLPDKTEAGWSEVLMNPSRFNMVWRHMLNHRCGQRLDITRYPPPIHLQSLLPGESHDA